jgi:NADP-dependent 3-hydroxy acid dehydrogenase YdfG
MPCIFSICRTIILDKISNRAPLAAQDANNAVFTATADVTDEGQVLRAVETAEKAMGPVDVLLTVAGQALTGHLTDVATADYKKSMDLNYFGTVHAVRAVIPRVRHLLRSRSQQ